LKCRAELRTAGLAAGCSVSAQLSSAGRAAEV
jgi:hypothetical protein